jgi:flavin reductase (DIM6/NTAB) family NADH-FMN oxidoreductase RutF
MKLFTAIDPKKMPGNPFQLIGSEWMLITAANGGQVNTMTASWGGLGVMWGMNVAYIALRPSRLTKALIDASDTFSLTFFDPSYKKQMSYLGTVSGRDEPKILKSGLTVAYAGDTPYFDEARLVLVCRKIYHQVYDPTGFVDPSIMKNYAIKDYHTFYIAEVTQVLEASSREG